MKSTIEYSFKSGLSKFWYNSKLFILELSDIRVCRGLHVFADDLTFLWTGHSWVDLTKNDDDDNFPSSFRVILEELPDSNFGGFLSRSFSQQWKWKTRTFLTCLFLKIVEFSKFGRKINKTTGYHQRTLRFPIFVKKAFKNLKTFFSRKNTFFNILSIFSVFRNFLIFYRKNSYLERKRHFYETIPFDTHSAAIPSFYRFRIKDIFFEKTHFFQERTIFWTVWEIYFFSLGNTVNLGNLGCPCKVANLGILGKPSNYGNLGFFGIFGNFGILGFLTLSAFCIIGI